MLQNDLQAIHCNSKPDFTQLQLVKRLHQQLTEADAFK